MSFADLIYVFHVFFQKSHFEKRGAKPTQSLPFRVGFGTCRVKSELFLCKAF